VVERKNDMLVDELEEILLRIDDLDRKILARLAENGRESFAALGQRVGLSTAATKRRVDRLRSEGVIRRFTADLEPAAMGWTIDAFVELYCEGRVPPDRMREMVRSIPEVIEAYTVTGESDGILRVRAADTSHLEKVLGVIRNYPGVSRTRSALVLSRL
jgi:DNA-binding Lrp family transcriptional regulator